MTLRKPTKHMLYKIAEQYNIHFTNEEMESFQSVIENELDSYNHIDRLTKEESLKKKSRDKGYRPNDAENKWNAWYWKTSIYEKNGKLERKRVVLKDNISLAGIPMMNGSSLLEGFIP